MVMRWKMEADSHSSSQIGARCCRKEGTRKNSKGVRKVWENMQNSGEDVREEVVDRSFPGWFVNETFASSHDLGKVWSKHLLPRFRCDDCQY